MRKSEAAKYARWSAAVALCVAGVTAAVYLQRGWQRFRDKKNAPPPAPVYVERQSTGLSFSKVEGTSTVFTVEASHSTDFKGENASLLEDVKVTIFGKNEDRHDILHTQSCRFSKDKGTVDCSGDVKMELLSAADAELLKTNPAEADRRTIHVATKGMMFDRGSGFAKTDQPISFRFPGGTGEAVGVEYHSDQGILQLLKDVHFTLLPNATGNGKSSGADIQKNLKLAQAMEVRGTKLDFHRESHRMKLEGPATAQSGAEKLTAGAIEFELDENFHARELIANAGAGSRPEFNKSDDGSRGKEGAQSLRADTLRASFSSEGRVSKIIAEGNVDGDSRSAKGSEVFQANAATLDLWPALGQPRSAVLRGNVRMTSLDAKAGQDAKPGGTRELKTEQVNVAFTEPKGNVPARIARMETESTGSLQWTDSSSGAQQNSTLRADKLTLEFDAMGRAHQLLAKGNTRVDRIAAGRPTQTITAQNGAVDLGASGGWSQMKLDGNVKLNEGDRNAQADNAVYTRADQNIALTGHAYVKDAATETRAAKIIFSQQTGDIRAEGGVRSTDFATKAGAVQLATAPANLSSDRMTANAKSGQAVYQGHARLWQGDSVLEAETIALQRDAKTLMATGNVRAVFPQSPNQNSPQAQKGPKLWHISGGQLTYFDKENRAHLEKNVVVQAADEKMQGDALDLYFSRGAASGTAGAAGPQQISRAVVTGGVTVEQGVRRATADRGEYTASDGKFVMSGGTPTIFDGSEGSTTGRQLTFFLADATIIVDSENGSRTLTKHRVEK